MVQCCLKTFAGNLDLFVLFYGLIWDRLITDIYYPSKSLISHTFMKSVLSLTSVSELPSSQMLEICLHPTKARTVAGIPGVRAPESANPSDHI